MKNNEEKKASATGIANSAVLALISSQLSSLTRHPLMVGSHTAQTLPSPSRVMISLQFRHPWFPVIGNSIVLKHIGINVGVGVGYWVGSDVGLLVDDNSDGALLGASDGALDGASDGASLGASDGALDGALEGYMDGKCDGDSV